MMARFFWLCFATTLPVPPANAFTAPLSRVGVHKRKAAGRSVRSAAPPHQTFDRWLEIEAWRTPNLRDVQPVMASLAGACRQINGLIKRTHTEDLGGVATTDGEESGSQQAVVNVQGEEQKKLDVVSNDLLKTLLCASGTLYCVASEEEEEPCTCSEVVGGQLGFDGDLVSRLGNEIQAWK